MPDLLVDRLGQNGDSQERKSEEEIAGKMHVEYITEGIVWNSYVERHMMNANEPRVRAIGSTFIEDVEIMKVHFVHKLMTL